MFKSKQLINLDIKSSNSETFELSNNSKKYISSKLNEEMKLNFSKFIQYYQIKIKDKKYFKEYLSDIAEKLISISHKKKGISKFIFVKYFKLQGMISLRLFSSFNTNNCNEDILRADDFIENMFNLYTGNEEYLFKLIFKLLDFNNTGKISHEEVSLILNFIPIKHSCYSDKKFKFEHNEFIDRIQTQEDIAIAINILFSSKNLISYRDFVEIIKNKNSYIFIFLLLYIFERKPFSEEIIKLYRDENISEEEENNNEEYKDEKKEDIYIKCPIINENWFKFSQNLNIQEFINNKFIQLNSKNYNYKYNKNDLQKYLIKKNSLKNIFNIHRSKSDESIFLMSKNHIENDTMDLKHKNNLFLPNIHFIMDENKKCKLFELKRNKNFLSKKDNNGYKKNTNFYYEYYSSENLKNNFELFETNLIKEGYLYKLSSCGKIKKYFVKLINNHLYYFKDKDSSHCDLDCLIKVFIKESYPREINNKYFYCFILIIQKKEKEFYVDSEDEYKNWLKIFKKILHSKEINELYDIQSKIGEGKFANVYKSMHKPSKRMVSIKILEKHSLSSKELEMIHNEIEILKLCQHPNILKLYDIIENNEKIYIITELIEGVDLFTYLENKNFDLEESICNMIIKKLSSALFYLNIFGIVHRDIKPENILLTNNSKNYNIKLIDFGLGIILGPNEKSEQPFGTVSYVAPEVLSGKKYDKSVDIWSLGILSYLLLVGRLPFNDSNDDENEIARQTINEPPLFLEKKWAIISNEAKDFVIKCLEKDPKNRININEILNHKWLKKYISDVQKNKEIELERLSNFDTLKILVSTIDNECK